MLTPKREKFCQEMAKLGNQRQAYKKAYNCENMKDETIDVRASELMRDGKVMVRLKELAEEMKNKNIAEAQEIQEMLTKIIRGETQEECIVIESCSDRSSEARLMDKQVTPKDRIKAAETLAKMRGYFDMNNSEGVKMPEIHIHGVKI